VVVKSGHGVGIGETEGAEKTVRYVGAREEVKE
jgi:hypothetical protein